MKTEDGQDLASLRHVDLQDLASSPRNASSPGSALGKKDARSSEVVGWVGASVSLFVSLRLFLCTSVCISLSHSETETESESLGRPGTPSPRAKPGSAWCDQGHGGGWQRLGGEGRGA
eukprot:2391118-Rhodomonas_salina.1